MNTLLLIEDDALLGAGLRDFLVDEGYRCLWLRQADAVAAQWHCADLVILTAPCRTATACVICLAGWP